MSQLSAWKPRSSAIGSYVECDFRAMLDRGIDEGLIPMSPEEKAKLKGGSMFTDFGTVCHFYLQDGTGCIFPGPSADFAPTPEEEKLAAGMTGNDIVAMRLKAREVATLAATKLPKAPDGKPWRSEIPYGKEPFSVQPFSGTVDFISQDGQVIGDLKTTSRPPEKNRIKTSHLIQMVCYHVLTGAPKGFVLYVSSKADWVYDPIWIDFAMMGDYVEMVVKQVEFLRSPALFTHAMPRMIDERCGEHFCPYTGICRDVIRPGAGLKTDTAAGSFSKTPVRTHNIFGGSK